MRVPSATKTGRNPKLPYVPVIVHKGPRDRASQVRGFAFETRSEAVEFARKTIELNDARCANKLECDK